MAESVRVEGLREIGNRLRALPPALGSKGGGPLRYAIFQAAKVIRDEAVVIVKAKTKTDSNMDGVLLSENIVTKRNRRPPPGTEQYAVGMKGGTRRYANTSRNRGKRRAGEVYRTAGAVWYGRMIELGTSKMRARPFLRPALAAKGMEAVKEFQRNFLKAVERAERKLAKQQNPRP